MNCFVLGLKTIAFKLLYVVRFNIFGTEYADRLFLLNILYLVCTNLLSL